MNRSFRSADWNAYLQILWDDGERVFCSEESLTDGDVAGVLTVRPAAEYPSPAILEHGLKDELDDAWAARTLQLAREYGQIMPMHPGRPALVISLPDAVYPKRES